MPETCSAKSRPLTREETRVLDVKISFLEGLVRRDPQYVEALQMLGDHYIQRGKYDHGLRVDRQLSRLQPCNPLVFYNLACSYSLNRALDNAVVALDKAISLGYRDFRWLAKDPDLKKFRQQPAYDEIKAKIRRMKIKTG